MIFCSNYHKNVDIFPVNYISSYSLFVKAAS